MVILPAPGEDARMATSRCSGCCPDWLPSGAAKYPISWSSFARAVRSSRLMRVRSEEHTSELQSLMRISYAVFCLKKKTQNKHTQDIHQNDKTHNKTQYSNTMQKNQ